MKHIVIVAALTASVAAHAWEACPGWDTIQPEGQRYELFASPFTHHWSHSPEHKPVRLLGLSKRLPNDRFCGISAFTNSFGQPSMYAYVGKTWPGVFERYPDVYLSVSAGIIYGYVGSYKNKVPLNVKGFSPGLIPAVGYRLTPHTSAEVQILGTAALMFGVSHRF
jgi:hypothetical protein